MKYLIISLIVFLSVTIFFIYNRIYSIIAWFNNIKLYDIVHFLIALLGVCSLLVGFSALMWIPLWYDKPLIKKNIPYLIGGILFVISGIILLTFV